MTAPCGLAKGEVNEQWERMWGQSRDNRLAILRHLYDGNTTASAAAASLAALAVADNNIGLTWTLVVEHAKDYPERQDKLVELLSCMAQLPDDILKSEPLKWTLLPEMGMHMNGEWNSYTVPLKPPEERTREINRFIEVNKFCAKLMATRITSFNYSMFALWTMRGALEEPIPQMSAEHNPPEAFIPAAAAWLEIMGEEMHSWDEEFRYGHPYGDPGRSGTLFPEKHGFDRQRWALWDKRLGELSRAEAELSEELRAIANQAQVRMMLVEQAAMHFRPERRTPPIREGLGRQRPRSIADQ